LCSSPQFSVPEITRSRPSPEAAAGAEVSAAATASPSTTGVSASTSTVHCAKTLEPALNTNATAQIAKQKLRTCFLKFLFKSIISIILKRLLQQPVR
jgi:hypothetical protein